MKVLCFLPISLNVEETVLFNKQQLVNNKKRLQQYVNGIDKFLNFNKNNILNKSMDVVISDNTFTSSVKFPEDITNIIKKYDLLDYVTIITHNNNKYGNYNKGCGIIEQWIYNKDLIKSYDWFIHFEPRQLLITNTFIETFIKKKSNIFVIGKERNNFNTGLFCIKPSLLLQFSSLIDLHKMVINSICIETILYNFMKYNNIDFHDLEKFDLLWHNSYNNTWIKM